VGQAGLAVAVPAGAGAAGGRCHQQTPGNQHVVDEHHDDTAHDRADRVDPQVAPVRGAAAEFGGQLGAEGAGEVARPAGDRGQG
jgi:hypothetical protein